MTVQKLNKGKCDLCSLLLVRISDRVGQGGKVFPLSFLEKFELVDEILFLLNMPYKQVKYIN